MASMAYDTANAIPVDAAIATLDRLGLEASSSEDDETRIITPRIKKNGSSRFVVGMVFGVVELCEKVLEHLDVKEIVNTTRICHRIFDIAQSSSVLHEKLFLRAPKNFSPGFWVLDGPPGKKRIFSVTGKNDPRILASKPKLHKAFAINSGVCALRDKWGNGTPCWSYSTLTSRLKRRVQGREWEDVIRVPLLESKTMHRLPAQASCDKMFLSSPPVKEVNVIMSRIHSYLPYLRSYFTRRPADATRNSQWIHGISMDKPLRVSDPDGVTLGQLRRTVEAAIHSDANVQRHHHHKDERFGLGEFQYIEFCEGFACTLAEQVKVEADGVQEPERGT